MLDAVGSPIPVAGFLPDDPNGAELLQQGAVTRRLLGSELVRAARSLAETVLGWWPTLGAPVGAEPVAGPVVSANTQPRAEEVAEA